MNDAPSLREPVEAADVLDAAADLIERCGWTSDHHWVSAPVSTMSWPIMSSPTSTYSNNSPRHHPNFNADGFCIVDALLKVHPQGKYQQDMRRAWASMKEPHCGRLGTLLMAVEPDILGFPEQLVGWNDAPRRTKDDVLAVLRGAAERARNAGSEAP